MLHVSLFSGCVAHSLLLLFSTLPGVAIIYLVLGGVTILSLTVNGSWVGASGVMLASPIPFRFKFGASLPCELRGLHCNVLCR